MVRSEVLAEVGGGFFLDVIGVASGHEGEAGGGTPHGLAVGVFEEEAVLGKLVEVGCLDDGISIATEGAGFQIIGDDEEDVFDFR